MKNSKATLLARTVVIVAALCLSTTTAWAADGGDSTNPTIINGNIGAATLNAGYYELRGTFTNTVRLTVNGDVHLILQDGCNVTIDGGINCGVGNSLTIYGNTGRLTANGNHYQAGIGGNRYQAGGNITINGGIVVASGIIGAGIGGGDEGGGGTIIINGGTVIATSSTTSVGGAGIGGGYYGAGGNITINGGTVTATGSIGSPSFGDEGGAGIGGGDGGGGGTITINGGVVTANGGKLAAGIGGGGGWFPGSSTSRGRGGAGGTIVINGGTILAAKGSNGICDIGPGKGSYDNGANGTVKITGGSVKGAIIPQPTNDGTTPVYLTTLTVGSPATQNDAAIAAAAISTTPYGTNGVKTDASGNLYFYLPQNGSTEVAVASGGTRYGASAVEVKTDNTGAATLTAGGDGSYDATLYTVTYSGNSETGGNAPVPAPASYLYKATMRVLGNTGGLAKTGYVFGGWMVDNGIGAKQSGETFTMPATATTLTAIWKKATVTGTQSGTLTYGTAGGATYTVTTENIADGNYTVTLGGSVPTGVTATVSITSGSGTLTLNTTAATPAGTTTNLTATIEGATSGAFTLTVGVKTLTWKPDGTVQSKDYDGTDAATVDNEPTLDGVINGNSVTVSAGSVTFDDENAGIGKTITASGWVIGGTHVDYYTITGEPTFAVGTITPRAITLTVDNITAEDYTGAPHMPALTVKDGTTPLTPTTDYMVGYNSNTNAGTATATVTGAGNYAGSTGSKDFTINQVTPTVTLSVSGATIRPASVTLTAGGLTTYATGTLTFKEGLNIIATATLPSNSTTFTPTTATDAYSFTVEYSGDGNYYPATSGAQAWTFTKGTQVALSITGLGGSYTYGDGTVTLGTSGGTTSGTVTHTSSNTSVATISGTTLTIAGTGSFTVTAEMAGNTNYNSVSVTSSTLTVSKKDVTVSISANDKVYDGTTAATLSDTTLAEKLATDDLYLTGGTITFADKDVNTNKTVTFSGYTLGGTDAGNYSLAGTSATALANITPAPLTVTPVAGQSKVYGSTDPTYTYEVSGLQTGDGTSLLTGTLTRFYMALLLRRSILLPLETPCGSLVWGCS
ncbi:hypothetical protein FACS1894199_15930 [Bacteroidia bacterium]|nr:hypothetical protein FACS1894199_15930 [Bacteroidia bacterium]